MPNEFPTVQTNMGCYDFCHPDARQVNYRFTLPADAPFPSIDYCIPEGSEYAHVTSNVYRAAETCLAYSQSCLYCGKVDDLTKLVAYLEEHWERHEVGRLEWERDQLQGKLAEIEGELAKARKQWTEMAREKVDTVAASRSQNQSCCGEEKVMGTFDGLVRQDAIDTRETIRTEIAKASDRIIHALFVCAMLNARDGYDPVARADQMLASYKEHENRQGLD